MFPNKLVAVINKDLEPGVALNALGHMSLGFGAHLGKEPIRLNNYVDADQKIYPNISQMPFIILRGKSNEIRKLADAAREQDIAIGIFTNTMTGGTFEEQLSNTSQTTTDDLVFYGIVLFGPLEVVNQLTKRFSLFR